MTRFNTQLVHGLPVGDNNTGAVNPPIYNSTTYAFEKVDAMPRYDYARSGNPTRDFLEQQIAQLEQGTRGFAFASGLAAIHAVLSIFKPGDRIVVGDNIYGGSYSQLNEFFTRWGILVEAVDTQDIAALEAAVKGDRANGIVPAQAVYFETLTNPLLKVNDVRAISTVAHRFGALSIVDNTFVTPYLQKPLALGADVVIHSATKYLAGHSDVNAGLVVVSGEDLASPCTSRRTVWVVCWLLLSATRCAAAFRRWPFAWIVSRRMPMPSPATCWCIRWLRRCITRVCPAQATSVWLPKVSRGPVAC